MGEVWRANDTRLGRAVAIKILPPELAQNAQLKVRFEREARAISQLSHPNICTLYDVGEENGTSFLVMEMLEGESLAERLARGPLPLADLLRIGVQIAVALDRAHRQHVVHRDLKPGNIMLTRSGAKLLDFGLAKTIGGAPPTEQIVASALTQKLDDRQPLTAEGTIVGTFQYMAPEQLEGTDADARTDIFALGAVLYEMTTGQRAFQGRTRTSLIAAIVRGEPQPLAQLQPTTPPALEHVIARCLAKDPEERWQSAADVAAELEWISRSFSGSQVAAPMTPKRKRREQLWRIAAALLALATIVLAVLLARRKAPVVRPLHASIVAPPATSYVVHHGHGGSITMSPDGKWITFAAEDANDPNGPSLWLRAIDSLEARKLITERFEFPFWSADSRSVAYFANGKLKRVDVSGGPPTVICDAQEGRGGTWSADGTIVFAPHWRGPLHRVAASGGVSQPVTTLDAKGGETTHRFPNFLPDGRHFVYLAGSHLSSPNSDQNAIHLASIDEPGRKLLLRARSNAIYANGHLLFVRENYLLAQPLDADDLTLGAEAKRIADNVEYEAGYFAAAFAAAADGTLVYVPKVTPVDEPIVWRDRAGKQLGVAATAPGPWTHRLSPDAKSIALVYEDPGDIWIHDIDRGARRRLTHDPLNDFLPVWSPDSTRVVYASDRALYAHLFLRRADGGGEELLLETKQMTTPSDWSRDGRYLFFEAASEARSSRYDLWVLDMTDRKTRALTTTDFDEFGARISPDGKWITYASDESGRREVYLASFPDLTRRQQISTSGTTTEGTWTSNGREIVYLSMDWKLMSVKVTPAGDAIQVAAPQMLFVVPRRAIVDATADGQRFLIYEPAPTANTPLTLVTKWD